MNGAVFSLNRLIQVTSAKLGKKNAKELERFIKFFIVGMIGFVVDFGTLNLLQVTMLKPDDQSSLPVTLATTIAFVAAISSNFIWNRYWTYPDSRSRPVTRQVFQFFIVNIAGWLFRLAIVLTLYEPFGDAAGRIVNGVLPDTITADTLEDQAGTNLAQALAVFIVMFWNFFVNRYWTYNDVE
jgi:putative flippase GtrA